MNTRILSRALLAPLVISTVITAAQRVTAQHIAEPTWLLQPSDTLSKQRNFLAGYAASLVSNVSLTFPTLFKSANENLMFKISEIKAKRVFWDAYATVPAYQDFIKTHCKNFPTCFSEIPLISKSSYIEHYPIAQTIKGGKIPTEGYMDPSSGTNGRRTLWIRGASEIKNTQSIMNLVRTMFLENDTYVLINMFLPSAWSLGLMRGLGPNVPEAYETMKDLGTTPKYLIMGHTSLMKYFVQHCPFDLAQHDVTFLLGGEHMSRALQQYFLNKGVKKVYAGYGASDINFTVGIQEDFAQKLQELCWSNPTLRQELTGSQNGLPYFFQYSPLHDYIEEINGGLVITDLDHTRISPRVRYDLGDRGKVLKMSFVQEILQKHAITLEPKLNFPLVCLYGRADHTIVFNNAELAFDDLELAILNMPELCDRMNRYAYNQFETAHGEKQLEFWIELKPKVSIAHFDQKELESTLFTELTKINDTFKRALETSTTRPVLKIYHHGKSPMVEETPMRKAKYLYHVTPEPAVDSE